MILLIMHVALVSLVGSSGNFGSAGVFVRIALHHVQDHAS